MTSDEERREIAANLREEFGQVQCQWSDLFRDMLAEILECDETTPDGAPLYDQMAEKLADLIDPTCHMEPEGEGFRCSACGTYHDMSGFEEFPWPRCPECGARVKGSNSMPLAGEGR